jgi:Cu/Ag efflux protein CusF
LNETSNLPYAGLNNGGVHIMKRVIIAAAGVLALAAGVARATDDKSTTGSKPSSASPATPPKGTAGTTAAGTSAAPTSTPRMDLPAVGDVKATDPAAMVITIVLQSGAEQQLNVAQDALITRDGDRVSLGQLQKGDNVRASFDPSSHKVSKVDVRSKSSKSTDKSNDSSKSNDAQKK